ncbi:DUF2235 domain-containing protein, partial [Celeribacter marinus]|uniref:DUF2235 domain-containing protein n=1 Tax=Celeribacter marinus TaxID=1397108 RepID=UPI003F6CB84E
MPHSNALLQRFRQLFSIRPRIRVSGAARARGPVTHLIILDGTMSSLEEGFETNAGLTYRLATQATDEANMIVRYEAGIQMKTWRDARDVIEGRGINKQIKRVYGALASRYHPGDRIYLMGYSRGAYAVRSLAGFIDKVGLIKAQHATEQNVTIAYRHYQTGPTLAPSQAFRAAYCHDTTPIEFLGVWDTVAAVGLQFPVIWRLSSVFHAFHDLYPPRSAKFVYHALSAHESRGAYAPVMFETNPDMPDQHLQQMWFRGTHGDVGGQLSGYVPARKLSNTTLVWMLDKAEMAGLVLPKGWRSRYLADPYAPSVGSRR